MPRQRRRGASDAASILTQRLNVRISPAAYQRLMVHCVMRGKSSGELLDALIEDHCREWKVQLNTTGKGNTASQVTPDDRLDLGDSISEMIAPVASAA